MKLDLSKLAQLGMGAVLGAGIYIVITRFVGANIEDMPRGYVFLILVTFLAVYYLSVIIHELTHFITFIMHGTEMRLLIMGPFIFNKLEGKWRFKFKFTGVFAMGGIAMPNLQVIDNEKEFEKFRRAFSRVLIAAPLSNLIASIVVVTVASICYTRISSELWRNYISFIAISTAFTALFINLSSLFKNDLLIGDYRGYAEMLKNREFGYVTIYQYLMISDKYDAASKEYIMDNITQYVEKALANRSFNNYVIGIVDNMINDYLTGKCEELPEVAKRYVEFAADNFQEFTEHYVNMELPAIFTHHMILYYSMEETTRDRALELYNKITALVNHKMKVLKYYDLRSRHALGIENNLEYISDLKNMRTSSLYELWRMFDWYYNDEINILSRLEIHKK